MDSFAQNHGESKQIDYGSSGCWCEMWLGELMTAKDDLNAARSWMITVSSLHFPAYLLGKAKASVLRVAKRPGILLGVVFSDK